MRWKLTTRVHFPSMKQLRLIRALFVLLCLVPVASRAQAPVHEPRRIPVTLKSDDVLPTGNEWIALPDVRAIDGALTTFNVLSLRDRGLLQVSGGNSVPVLRPQFSIDDTSIPLKNPTWELIEYWIPTAHQTSAGAEMTLTYCAPPGSHAAFIHMTLTNRRAETIHVALGLNASWGELDRVTYTPVALRGERTMAPTPWVDPGEVFSFITDDTHFAWSLVYPGATAEVNGPPTSAAPALNIQKTGTLAPGQTIQADFVLGVGVEEFSAAHGAQALRELLDRHGADEIIRQAATWCRKRIRTTGHTDLDVLMNRNYLFTALYAWGKTLDTEQTVGVTSRSPRYYVSAAYWDRDAMLWSFPGLLDIDTDLAREALGYALGIQLRNTGTHSRFIDGVVLEDGFQLDEGVAPVIAMGEYMKRTDDDAFLKAHRDAIVLLRDRLLGRFDENIGLFSSLQDSQDEYQKAPFLTYDNVLAWHALRDLALLFDRLGESAVARDLSMRADALHQSILQHCVGTPPGSSESIFAAATDGKSFVFTDIPPGSLMKLPTLGFVSEDDPLFTRTYSWLHSKAYKYSYADEPFGLPGSYRLPFTTSWTVADHLLLARGKEMALKVLRTSGWDGGIITEGVEPHGAVMDSEGRAFATAAGYIAHAICESSCVAPPGK